MDLLRQVLRILAPEEGPAGRAPTPPGPRAERPRTLTVEQLADRLGLSVADLNSTPVAYRKFQIPKRGGGWREISAPEPLLRDVQRRIVGRLLNRIDGHPAALGFERGRSTVQNAAQHAGRPVIVRMDVRDFFRSTGANRIDGFFAALGWDRQATTLLLRLTTHDGALPQGAPTSPRLSNLVNRRLDERLTSFASRVAARYTRYADDITFSFDRDDTATIHSTIRMVKSALADDGYVLHERRKLHIRRPYERQLVSGLVVNVRPRLARDTRRWLRAVEHHSAAGRQTSLSPAALAGWRAYRSMVERAVSR